MLLLAHRPLNGKRCKFCAAERDAILAKYDREEGTMRPKDLTLANTPAERRAQLAEVFQCFDDDGSGSIDASELYYLRRNKGRDLGTWLEGGRNVTLIEKLDADGGGSVEEEEFVAYYDEVLSQKPELFLEVPHLADAVIHPRWVCARVAAVLISSWGVRSSW